MQKTPEEQNEDLNINQETEALAILTENCFGGKSNKQKVKDAELWVKKAKSFIKFFLIFFINYF
jgi:hypothetical protein